MGENGTRDPEPAQKEKKSGMGYITGQLDRDTHKDLDTDAKVAAIHDNVTRHDPRAEQFFRYVQIFTAIVDSFSHGANDVANAMGPFAAAYVAYKKGKVVKQAEMDPGTMLWILALGGVGIGRFGYLRLQDHERDEEKKESGMSYITGQLDRDTHKERVLQG